MKPIARAGLAFAALVGLAGCDTALDARRSDLCRRTVPALAAKGSVPDIQRVGRGATGDTVRVDFRATGGADAGTKPHWILCRFERGTETLTGVTTDAGHVSGASLYLLRHYYLDTPDSGGADAGQP